MRLSMSCFMVKGGGGPWGLSLPFCRLSWNSISHEEASIPLNKVKWGSSSVSAKGDPALGISDVFPSADSF